MRLINDLVTAISGSEADKRLNGLEKVLEKNESDSENILKRMISVCLEEADNTKDYAKKMDYVKRVGLYLRKLAMREIIESVYIVKYADLCKTLGLEEESKELMGIVKTIIDKYKREVTEKQSKDAKITFIKKVAIGWYDSCPHRI